MVRAQNLFKISTLFTQGIGYIKLLLNTAGGGKILYVIDDVKNQHGKLTHSSGFRFCSITKMEILRYSCEVTNKFHFQNDVHSFINGMQ